MIGVSIGYPVWKKKVEGVYWIHPSQIKLKENFENGPETHKQSSLSLPTTNSNGRKILVSGRVALFFPVNNDDVTPTAGS